MAAQQTHTDFYHELLLKLPTSTASQLRFWTQKIIQDQVAIDSLISLACKEKPVASRFLWLLGDMAETAPKVLFPCLHQLFQLKSKINGIDVNRSLAKYWQLCGIPEEHEAEAIDMLFDWLNDSTSNVSLKMHAAEALFNTSSTYPELRNELKASLEEQLHKNSKSFNTRAGNLLRLL